MSQAPSSRGPAEDMPEPAWELARLFPAQGAWTQGEYLALDTNHLVEFSNGYLEFPPMPTTSHQRVAGSLLFLLQAFVGPRGLGVVIPAPLPVRLWRRRFCEPDVIFVSHTHPHLLGEAYLRGADMVMEVVIGDDEARRRDLVEKRGEYARARIPEYWIVDPREEKITVLRLAGKRYVVHGEFGKGTTASSHLLPGFTADVSETFSRQVGRASAPKGRCKPKRPPAP